MGAIVLERIRRVYRFGVEKDAWDHVPEPDNHFIAYKLYGETVHEYAGETHAFSQDMAMVANSEEMYRVIHHTRTGVGRKGDCIAVHFSARSPLDLSIAMYDCSGQPRIRSDFFHILDAWNQYEASGEITYYYACISYFYSILQRLQGISEAKEGQADSNKRLTIACGYFERNYSNNMLSISDAAEAAGVSTRRLSELFAQHFHTTPGRFLTGVRIRAAVELLEGPSSIVEIAERTGYANPSYFIRVFHREMGVSPAAYRAKMK